jgi:hypothetical protein
MEQTLGGRRSLPACLYHVTSESNWQQIKLDGILKQGKGYGWEERQGIFCLGWKNWLANLHYLSFLTLKLKGAGDKLVVLSIEMTPELLKQTAVAFISSIDTPVGALLLEKARAGSFSNIATADQVVLLPSLGKTLIRNTFPLKEFVRQVPTSDDALEYIIECAEIPSFQVRKVAEVAASEIPANFIKAGRRLARRMKYRQKTGSNKPVTRKPKAIVTEDDCRVFLSRLLASQHLLSARKTCRFRRRLVPA